MILLKKSIINYATLKIEKGIVNGQEFKFHMQNGDIIYIISKKPKELFLNIFADEQLQCKN